MTDTSKREELIRAVQAVTWNASNYPPKIQPHVLGQDIVPLTMKIVDAVEAVFEQAHTPADDEREALQALDILHRYAFGSNEIGREQVSNMVEIISDHLRRTAVPEPSAEPTEAMVEAGAREAFFTDDAGGHIRGGYTWDTIPEIGRQNYRIMVRAVMHAALTAAYETKGEGR